jgi:hypothetical protein
MKPPPNQALHTSATPARSVRGGSPKQRARSTLDADRSLAARRCAAESG